MRATSTARTTAIGALCELDAGQVAAALNLAAAACSADPDLACVKLVRAQTLFTGVSAYEAVNFLRHELSRDSPHWACRMLLAEMLDAGGNSEQARAVAPAPGDTLPDDAEAWYLRSLATLRRPWAIECARHAVERDPQHAHAWRRLVHLQLLLEEWNGALESVRRLRASDPSPNWAWLEASILLRLGRRDAAFAICDEVIERTGAWAAYRRRGSLHLRTGNLEQALADFNVALDGCGIDNAERWTRYMRGTVLWMLDRPQEALEDYRTFRRLSNEPTYAEARAYLILRHLGPPEAAQTLLNEALSNERCSPWLRRILHCVSGATQPEMLVAAADSRDREQVCEAHYYAGEACLLAGDAAAARQHFADCVATRVECDQSDHESPMAECLLARWRLRTLFGGD
jgi:tetratricopeptide (TPR) repeat protein